MESFRWVVSALVLTTLLFALRQLMCYRAQIEVHYNTIARLRTRNVSLNRYVTVLRQMLVTQLVNSHREDSGMRYRLKVGNFYLRFEVGPGGQMRVQRTTQERATVLMTDDLPITLVHITPDREPDVRV